MFVLPVIKLEGDMGHALLYFLTWGFNSSFSHTDFICELILLQVCSELDKSCVHCFVCH